MKMSVYVNVLSLAALLVSSSCMVAQESGSNRPRWVREKAKEAIDSLIAKAKKFSKDVKALRECHTEGTCTPEQYKVMKDTGTALVKEAVMIDVAAVLPIHLGRPVKY